MLLWSPETIAGPDLPAGTEQSQSVDSWAAAGEVKICWQAEKSGCPGLRPTPGRALAVWLCEDTSPL